MRSRRNNIFPVLHWLALVGLAFALGVWGSVPRAGGATACVESPPGQDTCDRFSARDANLDDLPNRLELDDNNDADVTAPTAEAGKLKIFDNDATSSAEDWRVTAGTRNYTVKNWNPILGGSTTKVTANNTFWLPLGGTGGSSAVADVQTPMPAGTLDQLRCGVSTAPGTGETVTFTVQSGACTTSLGNSTVVCTVSGTALTSSDLSNTATLTVGQCAAVKITYSSGAATSVPRFRLQGS